MSVELLHRAAALMREPTPSGRCDCTPGGGTWFDRSICPEPCASMHTRCQECGGTLGACRWEDERRKPSPFVLAVADWLDAVEAESMTEVGSDMEVYAAAVAVARAYLGE